MCCFIRLFVILNCTNSAGLILYSNHGNKLLQLNEHFLIEEQIQNGILQEGTDLGLSSNLSVRKLIIFHAEHLIDKLKSYFPLRDLHLYKLVVKTKTTVTPRQALVVSWVSIRQEEGICISNFPKQNSHM